MNKKENIIKAALELLVENGIHATPMSAIAKAAGTGMGTIYNYFPTKDILINAIYTYIKEQEISVFQSFEPNEPIKTQFKIYYIKGIEFFVNNPLFFKFIEQLQASPIITEESKNFGYKAIDPVIQLLLKGQQEKVIKNVSLEEILQFIGGAIVSYLRWYFNQTNPNPESINNQLSMVWDAIKK